MTKRLMLLAFAAVLSILTAVPATAGAANFVTDKYNVKVNVQDDNSAYINEQISIQATGSIHGIYRYIPMSQKVEYKDNKGNTIKNVRNPMKVGDFSVDNERWSSEKENGNMVIKIGDPDKTFTGDKTYDLSYRVRMYDDGIGDYDSFYYNVLPFEWETPIKESTITINMPKKFDSKNVDVYAGPEGSRGDSKLIDWKVKGRTITITTKGQLPQGDGITVGIKLKEGYFSGELTTFWMKILVCVISVIFALLLLAFWFRFGRDRKVIETVEFEPPAGMGPAEVGYVIDGSVDKKDVVSLIFWFAQKGYLSIKEEGKHDYLLVKEKDLPLNAKPFEMTFFNGLFQRGDGNQVRLKELGPEFSETYETVKSQIKSYYEDNKALRIFPPASSLARIGGVAIIIIGFAISALVVAYMYRNIMMAIPTAIVCALTLTACALGVSATDKKASQGKGKVIGKALLSIIFLLVAIGLSIFIAKISLGFIYCGFAMALMEAASYFAVRYMQNRTKFGAEIMGKLLGFREFIRVAEVEKLEELVEENPSYFYDVLPYAYVFGLSKKWAKRFENIPTEQPLWYDGYYGNDVMFNTWIFYNVFHSFDNSMTANIDIPANDGSGGFGGGGFSGGGGFGGGGGGSW
ncbi:MAG: DUF2207 domain-containing protein [Anaerovoracaceae bacterium]